MNVVITTLPRRLVERDVNEGLFDQVMALADAAANYLDGELPTMRPFFTPAMHEAINIANWRLTSRLLDMASLMMTARAWLGGDIASCKASERARTFHIDLGPWFGPENIPERLHELGRQSAALVPRVTRARDNLLRAIEATQQ